MLAKGEAAPNTLSFTEIHRLELSRLLPETRLPMEPDTLRAWVDAQPPLSALCLSGGGIRSASFALGVLQALAHAGVLGQFHYLSTVSGGGYIGGWLTAFRGHAGDERAFAALNQLQSTGHEPAEIAGLREHSNYLTPRLGVLSADTWAVVAQYVRNLLLNWMMFGPLFLAALMVPQLCARLLSAINGWGLGGMITLLALAAVSLGGGVTVSVCGRLRSRDSWLTDRRYAIGVLIPVVLAAASLTAAARSFVQGVPWLAGALGMVVIYVVADALGRHFAATLSHPAEDRTQVGAVASAGWWQPAAWALSGAVVGLLVAIGIDVAVAVNAVVDGDDMSALLVIFGSSWVVTSILLGELIYTGLTSYSPRSDMDQEWMARSAGTMAAAAVTWAVIAAVNLFGPRLLEQATAAIPTLLAGGISGVVALVFGASAKTAATVATKAAQRFSGTRMVSLAAVVFALFLAVVLSWVDQRIFLVLDRVVRQNHFWFSVGMVTSMLGLAALSLAISIPVNVNRFSLHALYRNRLIRAFLGSARGMARRGHADPFTGFDPKDNVAMASTVHPPTGPTRLLHIVNVALNVVSSRRLAWQERKAEAFSISPLTCGNPDVGYRDTASYGGADGISLGTATAISGAAVSPNQGYHSSPLVGFLLMLFNVRLGWWLGNPRYPAAARLSGPRIGLECALRELAGATTEQGDWVYLSDGGHFDNLGLYEMVRRRCRLIVVSDAGCDPQTRIEDLGNAVRKCAIDFGAMVEFDVLDLPARRLQPDTGAYCAVGHIAYPGGARGWLLYVKPAYHGSESAAIRSYALTHPEFPHETTSDQWFSESQFEAYRALGEHIFRAILAEASSLPSGVLPDLNKLEDWVAHYMSPPRPQGEL